MTDDVNPARLFYSYSHADEPMLKKLIDHLAVLRNQGSIKEWHDRKILPGDEFGDEIDENLDQSDVILLMISVSFLASTYCYSVEMSRALERHRAGFSRVIPVILKPCGWKGSPLGKLLALPTDGRPVIEWRPQDRGWVSVVDGITRAIGDLQMSDNTPAPDLAQSTVIRPMPDEMELAERLGQTLTGHLAEYLTKPAWVVNKYDFLRVVLPLKGHPEFANSQFPPPSEDALAWIDLYRYDDPSAVPTGLERWSRRHKQDDEKFILEFLPGDPVYVIVRGGYHWYTLGWRTVLSLDEIRGLVGPDGRYLKG